MTDESMLRFGGEEDIVRRLGNSGIIFEAMVIAIVVLLSASFGPGWIYCSAMLHVSQPYRSLLSTAIQWNLRRLSPVAVKS